MCLAIPMQVVETDGVTVRCVAKGAERIASLALYAGEPPVQVGDFVLIGTGYVLATLSAEEAQASWALFDQILAFGDAPTETD